MILFYTSSGQSRRNDNAFSIPAALEREGIPAAIIGKVTSKSQGFKILTSSGLQELPIYEQDEIVKIKDGPVRI
ncbi:MAG: hypothetical protein HYY46_06435 [Deltaproteobacteria bacterium]|nr:hypothetical protein [Deltaproteobacteria bacterium]